jgi:hypothetical protein
LEEETNAELHAEENGGGEDLIASALGETSAHDALVERVNKASTECTKLKKLSIELQEKTEDTKKHNIVAQEVSEEIANPLQNLTLAQRIQIQEQKAQAANIATQIQHVRESLDRTLRDLKMCQEDDQGSGCLIEKEKGDGARADLDKLLAEAKQHEMMARQSELDFGHGSAKDKKLVAEDLDIEGKKIHLADVEKNIAIGEKDEKEKEKAEAELKESVQQKAVDILAEELKEEQDPDVLKRLQHEMDGAKDELEEDKDHAASLTGKALRRKLANDIATNIMKEEKGILGSPEGLKLAEKVEKCMRNLKSAVGGKTPSPKAIIGLCTRCQPSVESLQNLTNIAMSPYEISKKYQQHRTYEDSAMVCLEEGRTAEDCSVRARGNDGNNGTQLPAMLIPSSDTNNSASMANGTATVEEQDLLDASECCNKQNAECLSCRASMSIVAYCRENDAMDAPISGCNKKDQVSSMNLTYVNPELETMAKEAEQNAELMTADEALILEEEKQTPKEIAEKTLNIVVQLGGMSCDDVVSPNTEKSMSRSLSVVLQTDVAHAKTTAMCDGEAGEDVVSLPIEERALEFHVQVECTTPAGKLMKKKMLQALNGGGLSSVTETLVAEFIKHDACPKESAAEKEMSKQEITQGGCSNVVIESLTPKHPGAGAQQFVTVFGYTMGDLMSMVGSTKPTRLIGPPSETNQQQGWLASENQRLTFVRSFLDEYNLQLLLKDEEDWSNKAHNGYVEKAHETEEKYKEALKIYKSSSNYHNPAVEMNKVNSDDGMNKTKTDFDLEMERIENDEKRKVKVSSKALKDLTNVFESLEPKAQNMSEPFQWPSEHDVVENWLGIQKNTSNHTNATKVPSMEELVKFQENEAAKKAKAAFLEQRKVIWEQRMRDLKEAAAEETLKTKTAKELHTRRVRIAGEQLDEQETKHIMKKKHENELKNVRLNEEYEKIENQTDSMDASEYMAVLKETTRLKVRDNELHEMDVTFETGVNKLKKVEAGQLNMTHDEKEELAEEVQDDMMKLDVEVSSIEKSLFRYNITVLAVLLLEIQCVAVEVVFRYSNFPGSAGYFLSLYSLTALHSTLCSLLSLFSLFSLTHNLTHPLPQRARAAAEATQAEMQQTAKEFEQVKALQTKQKVEDQDTMEKAAEAIEHEQEKQDQQSNMTEIDMTICFFGLTAKKWKLNDKDNDFLLKTFIIKWIGIDPTKMTMQLVNDKSSSSCAAAPVSTPIVEEASLLEVRSQEKIHALRNGLGNRLRRSSRLRIRQEPSIQSIESMGFRVTMKVPTDRKEDIASVEKAVHKLEKNEQGSEIIIAMNDMLHELGNDITFSILFNGEKFVREEGATPPEKRTNATKVEEAAQDGNLSEMSTVVNATDTPDIANAVETQQMEQEATEGTMPLKVIPDQAISGPSFPGAFGTGLKRRR